MDINQYQVEAFETFQFKNDLERARTVSLLGLPGEVGELLTEYKKRLRDGDHYSMFREQIVEEIGDIMWYLSALATIEDIQLSEILEINLRKTSDRWNDMNSIGQLTFDEEFEDDGRIEEEKFPREFVANFKQVLTNEGKKRTQIYVNGMKFGDDLSDNTYNDDYYRFHDVFHLSYVVMLGWSPIARRFFKCKRKSDDQTDEIEDGGRAAVIDEAISALVFQYASCHDFFEGVHHVDYELLRTIKKLTQHLEVRHRTAKDWENAILLGFNVWRDIKKVGGGRVVCDMTEKTMVFEHVPKLEKPGPSAAL